MAKKIIYFLIALLVILLGLTMNGLLSRENHTISEASFDRIRIGMTESEVEATLASPAGWYTSTNRHPYGIRPMYKSVFSKKGVVGENGQLTKGWASDHLVILVSFNEQGRVIGKYLTNNIGGERLSLVDGLVTLLKSIGFHN